MLVFISLDDLRSQAAELPLQILVRGFHCTDSTLYFSYHYAKTSRMAEWDFGDGRKASVDDPQVSFPAAGIYQVTLVVTDNFSRKDTATIDLQLFDCREPVVCLSNSPLDIGVSGNLCADSLAEFYAVTDLSLIYYRWESAGALQSFAPSWQTVFRAGELADIRLVGTDERGCVYEGPLVTRISECLPYCPDTVMVETESALCADSLLLLRAVSEASLTNWRWEVNGMAAGADSTLALRLPAGLQLIGLSADADRGCTYQSVRELFITPGCQEDYRCALGFPTAFSPNGDGINDRFGPLNFCPLVDYELIVFNRWGARVFFSNDLTISWDGTAGGDDLPVGMYVWIARYQTLGGDSEKETGSVTLLR